MLTFYVGFPQPGVPIDAQTEGARATLFATSYADYELQIRRQLQTLFGEAGFDARRDIAGIVLNRWGHAYLAPQPGFYFGNATTAAPLGVIRERYGRIAFGHSELSGRQSWGRSARRGGVRRWTIKVAHRRAYAPSGFLFSVRCFSCSGDLCVRRRRRVAYAADLSRQRPRQCDRHDDRDAECGHDVRAQRDRNGERRRIGNAWSADDHAEQRDDRNGHRQ
jgi:hypothetical protein